MIDRPRYLSAVTSALKRNPICALLGPRQCGKTTLARQYAAKQKQCHFFDLETAVGQARLAEPELALSELAGIVIIDEIQRRPALFEAMRPLADRPRKKTKFLILGSASPDLVRGTSESLAGRVEFVDLSGFDLNETGPATWKRLWLRGGFPRSYLASSGKASLQWRSDFARTFLERDIPQLGSRVPAEALRRFWMMLAHYHGQIWNGAELARGMGVSEHTVRGYLDLLSACYLVRQIQPWFENISKRQFKAPKVYIRDSGLLHALLSLGSHEELQGHPKRGASWEGFGIEQVLGFLGGHDAYYWGTHAGAELDLLLIRRGKRFGCEFKCTDAPSMTKSLHIALSDLRLDRAWIIYPGTEAYAVDEKVEVIPLTHLHDRLAFLA